MQRSGVGFLGEVGPKAPIVLGTKRRKPCSAAISRMLCSPGNSKQEFLSPNQKKEKKENQDFCSVVGIPKQITLNVLRHTSNIHRSCQRDISFSNCTEQSTVMK